MTFGGTYIKRTAARVLVAACVALAAAAALELAARFVLETPVVRRMPRVERMRPRVVDGSLFWDSPSMTVAEQGAPGSAFNIVGIGDEIMAGDGVTNRQTYMRLLQRNISRGTGRSVRCVNLAYTDYSIFQERVAFQQYGVKRHPDLVILHIQEDDFHPYRLIGERVYALPQGDTGEGMGVLDGIPASITVRRFIFEQSRFVQMLNLFRRAEFRGESAAAVQGESMAAFTDLVKSVEQSGAALMVIFSPRLDEDPGKPHDPETAALYGAVGEHLIRRGHTAIDLRQNLADINARGIGLDARRFNARGHRILARILSGAITRKYLRTSRAK